MKPRLYSRRVRASAIASVAGLAAAVTFAAAPSAAQAQFGFGAISGTVNSQSGALEGATVTALPVGGGPEAAHTTSHADGTYTIVPLPAGNYKVRFDAPGYVREFYDNAPDLGSGQPVAVAAFATTSGINATLTPEATISGTVIDEAAQPLEGVCVSASPQGGGVVPDGVQTDALGHYTMPNLVAGTYAIEFDPCDSPHNAVGEWYDDKPSELLADPITLTEGEDRTGVGAELATGGSISGTVLDSHGQPAELAQINVRSPLGVVIESATTAPDGTYSVGQLATGTYKVEFLPPPGSLDLPEFYDDQPDQASATPVLVTVGGDTPGIDAALNADTIPPVVTINGGPSGPTNESTPTFDFSTEAGATLQCSIDTGTPSYGPCSGDPTSHAAPSALADGDYTFRVQAMDPTGNTGEDTQTFTVDTQPPSVSITGGPIGPTGFTTPTFTFSSEYDEYEESAPGFECAIDPAGDPTPNYGACTTSTSHTPAPLADGDYVFRVRATDAAANSTVAQRAFTVDSDGPQISIGSGPSGPTNDATPTYAFSASQNATLECAIDPPAAPLPSYGPCSDVAGHTPSTLADGDYVFRVRATDDALHSNTDQRSFSVDTVAPTVSVTGGPNGPTNDATPSFDFTSAGGSVQCAIDAAGDPTPDWASCSEADGHDSGNLADGAYVFRVRATDAAGNVAADQRSFTVDTVISVSITSGPNGPTNDPTPSFGFNAEAGSTVECSLDTGTASYGPCSSASEHTPTTLADGPYTFRVRATDAAGNVAADQRSFTVDTVISVSITSGPNGPTNDPTPTFGFNAEAGSTVECSLDTGTPSFGPCSSASEHTPATLADGPYTFRVRATDAAGNSATDQRAFTLDTGISLSIVSGPNGPTNDPTPSFGFNAEAGASVECSIDTGTPTYGSCSSGAGHTPPALANGGYTFRVRATDAATNSSVATRDFSVDTIAPSLSITGGPSGETTNPTPTFTFNAEPGAAVQCSLDTGTPAFAPCSTGSSHTQSTPLADGAYVFRVRATDSATNSAMATRSFELDAPTAPPPPPDTTPPTIEITDGPKGKTKDKTPTFGFESNDTFAAFSCKVDNGAAFDCTSPTTLKKLKPGKHTFSVTATDRSGNKSAPASQAFTVKKKKKKGK